MFGANIRLHVGVECLYYSKIFVTTKFDNQTRIFTVIFNSKEIKKEKIIEAVESVEEQFKVKNWKII